MKSSKLLLACAVALAGAMTVTGAYAADAAANQAPAAQSQTKSHHASKHHAKDAKHAKAGQKMTMNWYGGEAYLGQPALDVTAALVQAGGGAENFSFAKALVAMLGEKTVNAEVAKLNKQYGEKNVQGFIGGMDYAVKDALKRATEAKVVLPPPAKLSGVELAKTLVQAGTTKDNTFWAGYLFDKALGHDLHNQVMTDINTNVSPAADELTHKILNQAMYDVAQALGLKHVKLAKLH